MFVLTAAGTGAIRGEMAGRHSQPPSPRGCLPQFQPHSRVGELGTWISEEGCVGALQPPGRRSLSRLGPGVRHAGPQAGLWEGPQDHPALAAIKLGEQENRTEGARPLPLNLLCSSSKFPEGSMGLRRRLGSAIDPATRQSVCLLVPQFSHL